MIRTSGVYVITMHQNLTSRGVEVLVLQLSYRTSVHRVRKIRSESLYVKMVRTASDLLVRREADTHLTVLDLRVINKVLHGRYDLRDTRFVVCTKQRCVIRHNKLLTDVSVIDMFVSAFVTNNTRLHMLSACIRTCIHMGNKTYYGNILLPFREGRGRL